MIPRYVPKSAHGYKRLMEGLDTWINSNGFCVMRLHYTADESKRSEEWRKKTRQGMTDPDLWDSEMEIAFDKMPGVATFSPFSEATHVTKLEYKPDLECARSWDFGYKRPAVGWFQIDANDRVYWLDLLFGKETGTTMLTTDQLCTKVKQHHRAMKYGPFLREYADIAGDSHTSNTSETDYTVMATHGFNKPKNSKVGRHEALNMIQEFLQFRDDGLPGLIINEHLTPVISAMDGAYKLPPGRIEQLPKDGFYEHIFDMLAYFLVNRFRGRTFRRRYYYAGSRDGKSVFIHTATGKERVLSGKRTMREGSWQPPAEPGRKSELYEEVMARRRRERRQYRQGQQALATMTKRWNS